MHINAIYIYIYNIINGFYNEVVTGGVSCKPRSTATLNRRQRRKGTQIGGRE